MVLPMGYKGPSRMTDQALLSLRDVSKAYLTGRALSLRRDASQSAVDGVSLTMNRGQTLSLVGESGCGKTTTAKLILRLERPDSGSVLFEGDDIWQLRGSGFTRYRTSVQAVFQDPLAAMNPRHRARDIIAEPLRASLRLSLKEVTDRVASLLVDVGLEPAHASRFPHEFSGGQRQRILIARALSSSPALIVLDEPISALDVSIRAQIINLLRELQQKLGLAFLLIAHDLSTVRGLSDRIAVMYLGRIVEAAPSEVLFRMPSHPYLLALLSAALPTPPEDGSEIILSSEMSRPPGGCRFRPRCWLYERLGRPERCTTEEPDLREVAPAHETACHFGERTREFAPGVMSALERRSSNAKPVAGQKAARSGQEQLTRCWELDQPALSSAPPS